MGWLTSEEAPIRILILSPHTDDAEIGCGGSMAKWGKEHRIMHYAFSAASESLLEGTHPDATRTEFWESCQLLPANGHIGNIPVRRFTEHRQDILDKIMDLRATFDPHLVVGPSHEDCHQDHRVVHEEMVRAFRRSASIICYEHPRNDLGFAPQMWNVLTEEEAETKVELVGLYRSQLAKPDSFMGRENVLAGLRFRGSQVNARYAEAFSVARWIIS
jgi:LmbE family N-acetylglucosaminyl deacetylase